MDKQTIGYWMTTGLFGVALGAGGVAELLLLDPMPEQLAALGYPTYFGHVLGLAKVLGVVALVVPGFVMLGEWAYAGFTFTLLGASASHVFSGDPIATVLPPLVLLGLMAMSYLWRPAHRRVVVANPVRPATAPREVAAV